MIFATVRPTFDRMGRIKDISKGGLAMEYTLLEEKPGLADRIYVDIFNNDRKYNLFNVPCRVIYDMRIDEGEGFLPTVETRRCGVKFENLKTEQLIHLQSVLREISGEEQTESRSQYEGVELQ
jgi:hypothetical protein